MNGPGALLARAAATASGAATLALVLAVGMVVAGLAWPSGEAAPYRSLTPSAPVRLVAKAVEVNAPVVPIEISQDAVLDPPHDARVVGWWTRSAKPGSVAGQTVITGHTVATGGGALDRVGDLRAGQHVDVVTRAGRMRYEVTDVRELGRDDVARQAVDLFGQDAGAGRLVLVTCTDWNGSYYEKNVIVFADPLGRPVRKKKAADTLQAAGRM